MGDSNSLTISPPPLPPPPSIDEQVVDALQIFWDCGCHGVFLSNNISIKMLGEAVKAAKLAYPHKWIGEVVVVVVVVALSTMVVVVVVVVKDDYKAGGGGGGPTLLP